MNRGILAAIVLCSLLVSGSAIATEPMSEPFIPGPDQYKALQDARRCSIMVAVEQDAKSAIDTTSSEVEYAIQQLNVARKDLENCAQSKGIKDIESEQGSFALASFCPQRYERWVQPGLQLQFVKRELRDAQKSYDLTHSFVKRHCRFSFNQTSL